ncbi:MAG: hypothetical protein HYT87_20070 [Nitrospirae bacterium]|nr:hypothetical protein [Nitrospirota bacterium]
MNTMAAMRQKATWAAFCHGGPLAAAAYNWVEPRWRRKLERTQANDYDDRAHAFRGGDMEELTRKVYEKALRKIWKAEVQAPYLGFHDATEVEKLGVDPDAQKGETDELMERATSEDVRREFEEAFSPEQREAVCKLMSLIAHGEAYALYTSSTLLPVVTGTGSKMGMAMQVMEEAKHFIVLRAMVRTLGHSVPLHDSAFITFEKIAQARPYLKLYGMNVVLESFATSLFAQFADFPGLRHILPVFHLDESRHVGFPKNYYEAGNVPEEVTNSRRDRLARELLLLPAAKLIWDYKDAFEAVGMDCFGFFGRFVAKATRLAENSGMPLLRPREEFLAILNLFFNSCVRAFEPEKFTGYRDYTELHEGEIRPDILAIEKEVFGEDVFGIPYLG